MCKRLGFEIDDKFRRLANRLECDSAELVPELLALSCPNTAACFMKEMSLLIIFLRKHADQLSKWMEEEESKS